MGGAGGSRRADRRDQINASGELRPGRTVLVKGLLIETDGESRINLTSVVGLANSCD